MLTLVNNWDPAGLLATGAPRDSYEGLVDKVLGALSAGTTKEQLGAMLEAELRDRFGKKAPGVAEFVNRALAWHNLGE